MIKYEIQGNMAVILGASKEEVDLYIPETIENKPVGKIMPDSFVENRDIKTVIIPGSCKVIGAYSFASCKNLTEVTLEEGVEVIEDWAFINCNIDKIKLPKSLKSVGGNAFLGNKVKPQVTEFMDKITLLRRPKYHTNNKCAVLPISFKDNIDKIDDQFITKYSKYIDSQYDQINEETLLWTNIDIPMIFDGDEFILAIYNKRPLEDLKIELQSDTLTKMGLYSEKDPDFLSIRFNVLTKGQPITSFVIKTPYLEACNIEILDQKFVQRADMLYYILHCKADLSCFGTGNYERKFALNQYDELIGKYNTEYNNKLITEEQYNEIQDAITNRVLITMNGFLMQLDGAYEFTHMLTLLQEAANDLDAPYHDEAEAYLNNFLYDSYQKLADFNSLYYICFDTAELKSNIEGILNMTIEEIAQKYNVDFIDTFGNQVTEEVIQNGMNGFIKNQANFDLHGDFLAYSYGEMKTMNDEYEEYKFTNNSFRQE